MKGLATRAGMLVLAALMLAVGWFGGLYQSGNYHAVLPGELYRSAQLSGEELSDRIARDGIRSVLNLRGSNPGAAWYPPEVAAALAAGVAHYDLPLLSSQSLSRADAERLVALMRDAPKPLLVHCEGGADRTGLATALYLAATGHPLDQAAGQLSARYGFVGIEGVTRPWPMWESWERLGPALAGSAQVGAHDADVASSEPAEGAADPAPAPAPPAGGDGTGGA